MAPPRASACARRNDVSLQLSPPLRSPKWVAAVAPLPGALSDLGASHLGAPAPDSPRSPANLLPPGSPAKAGRQGGREAGWSPAAPQPLPLAPARLSRSPGLSLCLSPGSLASLGILRSPRLLHPSFLSSPQLLLVLFSLTSLAYLFVSAFPPPLCFLFPDTSVLPSPTRRLPADHTFQVQANRSSHSATLKYLSSPSWSGTGLAAGEPEMDMTQNPPPGTS